MMQRHTEASLITESSSQRLLFPAWIDSNERRVIQRRKRFLCAIAGLVIAVLTLYGLASALGLVGKNSDKVLGKALRAQVVSQLGLPTSSPLLRSTLLSSRNPWRGAGARRRNDLLSSVSGCGGNYRPRLRLGESASIFYSVRDGNGTIDSTRDGVAVDVVLGARQIASEAEERLDGLCAGETIEFSSGDRVFILHVARVGVRPREDQEARKLEGLSKVLKAIPARRGSSCNSTCRRVRMQCVERGFRIINSCPRLREAFKCRTCETAAAGSSGPDMPCYVELSAPVGHPRGFCMVNPKVQTATCEAKYVHTRRLCPCVRRGETSDIR